MKRTALMTFAIGLAAFGVAQTSETTTETWKQFQTSGRSIDTRHFLPQIDRTETVRFKRPANPGRDIFERVRPLPERTEPNTLPVGGIGNFSSANKAAYFRGLEDNSSVPPDTCGTAGPNHIVMMVNTRIGFYNKTTGVEILNQSLDTFFASVRQTDFLFDPKVVYDSLSNRFIVMCLEQRDAPQNSGILLGVSDDNDPNGTWRLYRINAIVDYSGTSTWQDYVSLGYNKDGILMGANSFGFSSGSPGCAFFIVRKAEALTGAALTVSIIKETELEVWTPQGCETPDPTLDRAWFVTAPFGGGNTMNFHRINNITTTPTKTKTVVTVPTHTSPTFNCRSTSGRTLDSMDGRLYNAVMRNNKIVTVHNHEEGGLIKSRWYQFDVNTGTNAITLNQSGNVSLPTTDCHMGGISINAANDIGMVFTRSSTTITADIMFASRKATDPAGTMGTPVNLESSAGNNYAQNRWGDYAAVAVDPSDSASMWAFHMNVRGDNFWRTGFFKIAFGIDFTFTLNKSVVAGQNSVLGTITLNGIQPTNTVFTTFDDSSLVTTPTPQTVLAGQLTRSFQITVQAITSTVNTTISARLGAVTKTAPLQLAPLIPTAMSFTPSSVTGGTSTSCRVVVNGVAGPGGRLISIVDNSAFSTVPSSVTVPAGSTSVTFPITTVAVTSIKNVTVTALVSAGQKTGVFTITP